MFISFASFRKRKEDNSFSERKSFLWFFLKRERTEWSSVPLVSLWFFLEMQKEQEKKEPQGPHVSGLFNRPHGVLVVLFFGITEITAFSRDNAGAPKYFAANEVVDLSGISAFAERRAFSKVVRVWRTPHNCGASQTPTVAEDELEVFSAGSGCLDNHLKARIPKVERCTSGHEGLESLIQGEGRHLCRSDNALTRFQSIHPYYVRLIWIKK